MNGFTASLLFAFGLTPLPTLKNYVVLQLCVLFVLANSQYCYMPG